MVGLLGVTTPSSLISMLCELLTEANKAISRIYPRESLTPGPFSMEPKKRRKTKGTVIIGRGAATVRIYPITRKDGYRGLCLCGADRFPISQSHPENGKSTCFGLS